MDLTDTNLTNPYWQRFRQEVTAIVCTEVGKSLKASPEIRRLQNDVADMKHVLGDVKHVLGTHSVALTNLQADMRSVKNTVRSQSKEIHKLGVLFEDLDYRFAAAGEAN